MKTKSTYPKDWQLTEKEIMELEKKRDDGLCTTNGDTDLVKITVRQLTLLLEHYEE